MSEAALPARLEALSRQRFDLALDLPITARLLRLGPELHVLAVVVHHIAFDGWSSAILLQELTSLYAAALEGSEAGLSPLPIQYADYALWQRRHHSAARDLDYWRAALAAAPEALSLPTDRPRGPRRGRGERVALRLEGGVVVALRDLARREGVTLFMVLQAALSLVLGRWSGQTDILLGTPVANRTRHEIEGLIGFFVNTLVLRTRLAGDQSVRGLLSQVRETALGAFAHQALPFEQLVEELQPVRSLERSPLFQVMLVLQNQAQAVPALAGVAAQELALGSGTAKFELALSLAETSDGLAGELEYDCDLYDRATAERLLAHLERALRFLAASPEAKLSALSLLSPDERRTITAGLERDRGGRCRQTTLPALFAAQAARDPAAVAVVCGGAAARLWRARRALEPAGAAADRSRHRPRDGGRPRAGALGRAGGGGAGGAEGGRLLPAARCRPPAGPARLPARRCRRGAGADHRRAGRAPAARGAGAAPRRRRAGAVLGAARRRRAPRRARPRPSRLYHLHLGIHRRPQGGDGAASRRGQSGAGAYPRLRCPSGRPAAAIRLAQLRRLGGGAVDGAAVGRDAGDGAGRAAGAGGRAGAADGRAGDHPCAAGAERAGEPAGRGAGAVPHAGGGRRALPAASWWRGIRRAGAWSTPMVRPRRRSARR